MIKSLLNEKAQIFAAMQDLKNRVKGEDRSLTAEERGQFDKMLADYEAKNEEIAAAEKELAQENRFAEIEAEQSAPSSESGGIVRSVTISKEEQTISYGDVLNKWAKNPKKLSSKERGILEQRGTSTNVTTDDGLGGYSVPEDWDSKMIKVLTDFGPMLDPSFINFKRTESGNTIHMVKRPYAGGGSAAAQKGHLITENTQDTVADVNFTEILMEAYVYSSYEIQVTWELMQDSMFNLSSEVLEVGYERNALIANEHLTLGTGIAQPNGAVTAAPLGHTTAAIGVLAGDDILKLKYSLPSPYVPSASFMLNYNTLGDIASLSFGVSDTAVWIPSFQQGEPDRILGHPYKINPEMADVGTGNKPLLFGNFKKYMVRQAGYPEVARSDERDIAYRRSVFYVFHRYDGELLDDNAMRHLIVQ